MQNVAKLYYTSWLGSNWEKKTIFWDQSQINWDQFGSIPKPCHPKPRPTTPTDFSEISKVLHQKEKFGFLKIIYAYLSINRRNSFSESTVSDLFKKVKVGWVWFEIFWPVRFCFCWLERSELRKSGIWNGICKRLDLCLNHVTALISEQFME